jgi:hypothetical protein
MDHPTKFGELVQFRAPANLSDAIDRGAKQKCQSKSDYVRQSVIRQLEVDRIAWACAYGDAGSLYDRNTDGRERFAWVDGDLIRAVSYLDAKPEHEGRTWLPVKHFDSERFDPALHWRLKPILTIEPDHVRCEYPVVPKSMEHA